jgi:hypothetical protein
MSNIQTVFYEPERRIGQAIKKPVVKRVWGRQTAAAARRRVALGIFPLHGGIERTICTQAREDYDE